MNYLRLSSIVFLILLGFPFLTKGQNAEIPANQKATIQKELFVLVIDNTINLTYFLNELEILEYQRVDLRNATKSARVKWLDLVSELHENQSSANSEPYKSKFNNIKNDFADAISNTLLKHQVKALRQLVRQRQRLAKTNAESFLLPVVVASELELTKKEQTTLSTTVKEIVKGFESEKQNLEKSTWQQIEEALPDQSLKRVTAMIKLVRGIEKLDLHSHVSSSTIENWDTERFDKYERKRFRHATFVAPYHLPLRELLALDDLQVKQIETYVSDANASLTPNDFVDPNYAKIIFATPEGKLDALKKELKRKIEFKSNFDDDLANEIVSNILLSPQREKLERLSKFSRYRIESKMGDEFGAMIAWAKSNPNKNSDYSKFERLVEESRNTHHEKMSELRASAADKVIQALPEPVRKKYLEMFGKPYDFEAERIFVWDELRGRNN